MPKPKLFICNICQGNLGLNWAVVSLTLFSTEAGKVVEFVLSVGEYLQIIRLMGREEDMWQRENERAVL